MARKIASKGEMFVLVIVCLVLLTFALKRCGVDVGSTSTETEIIDRPHD